MVDVGPVVQEGVAIILLIVAGYVITKFKFINKKTIDTVNKFLLRLCYPPLIFRAVGKCSFSSIDFTPMLIGILVIVSNYVLIAIVFFLPLDDKWYYYLSTIMPSVYTNYLIIGLPFFHVIWGDDDVMVTIINLTNDLICVPLYLILANIYQIKLRNKAHKEAGDGIEEKFSFKLILTIIKNIILNPIMFGNIVGFIWAGAEWPIFPFLSNLCNYPADGVLGLCLMCVGGFLSQFSIISCPWPQFIVCVLTKHVMMSLIAALFCAALGVNGTLSRQCALMTTMPSATASFLLSYTNKTGPGVSSTMLFFSTILCIPAMIAWLSIFDALHIFE